MRTLVTFTGKAGDTFLQWQAVRTLIHYQPGDYTLGLGTLLPGHERLIPLFYQYSPVPVRVERLEGVTYWKHGGQPWDFGLGELPPAGYDRILHCGYREHPQDPVPIYTGRMIGLTEAQLDTIPFYPSFVVNAPRCPGRLIFHCPLLGQTGEQAQAWRILATLLGRYRLKDHFDVLAVGLGAELEKARLMGLPTEAANWPRTAELLAGADAAFCGGSSVAALAGCLHVPCVRLGSDYECYTNWGFRPWSNVAPNQLNVVASHYRLEDLVFDFLRNQRRAP